MQHESVLSTLLQTVGFDHLSWILLALILSTFFIQGLITPDASWTVHPILLGHQSDFSRIRKQSETPIITNSSSTHGLLPVTPERSIKSLHDLLLKSEGKLKKIDISSTIPADHTLKFLISNVRNHIWSLLVNIQVNQDKGLHQVVILCADPHVKLIFSLASATLPIVTILGNTYQSGALPVDVKRVIEPYFAHSSLIITEISKEHIEQSLASNLRAQVISIKDISNWFQSNVTFQTVPPETASELSKARLLIVHNFPKSGNKMEVGARLFEFTPENILAGITASLGLFPSSGKLTSTDRVALESYGNASIWGSEFSIAAAALYAGADVYFFDSFKHLSECKPTILVIKAMTAQILSEEIIQLSKLSFFKKLSIGYRLSKVSSGTLATSIPETVEWVGPKLRAILTYDPISQSCANLIRAGFGVTLQKIYTHPVSAGPILASQPYDFQTLQLPNATLHCGPPSVNVECKIVDVPEPSLSNNDAWKGKLLVRGPSIAVERHPDDIPHNSGPSSDPKSNIVASECFYDVAQIAHVLPNGTFRILSDSTVGDD